MNQNTWQDFNDAEQQQGFDLIPKGALVKVLGRGEVTRAVTVKVHGASAAAESAITAAGGTACRLFADGFESGGTLAWSLRAP